MAAERGKNTLYVSAQISRTEKTVLDDAAAAAGVTRNRFIRMWIASLATGRS